MSRARWTTRALGPVLVAATLVAGPVLAGASLGSPAARGPQAVPGADEDVEVTPLSVTLTGMSPSEVPRKGAVTLTGVVTNVSDEDWADVNLTPFTSSEPMTTRDELAEAALTTSDEAVGERLTDEGVSVGDLAAGEEAAFSIRVPSSLLIPGGPGVYWIGVHALGANSEGRDLVADGRARTFIPLVTAQQARQRSVPVSLVLPLRERARRAADGRLNGPTRWVQLTKADGRLTRIVEFGASAGTAPVSWLVDPAVLDGLDDFRRGNPPLSLEPEQVADPDEDPDNDPDQDPDEDPDEDPTRGPSARPSVAPGPGSPSAEERARAQSVLEAFLATARTKSLLTLGYSDPDIASLARRRASLIKRANELAARRMEVWGLTGSPAIAPPRGYFDPELLPRISKDALLVLSDRGRLQDPTLSRLPSGQDLVLTDARSRTGGPTPNAPRAALALRQRILSEAALEVAKGDEPIRPIVVALPYGWDPGPNWRQADFFGGVQTPWVRLAPMPRVATSAYDGRLAYGRSQRATEIGDDNVAATRTLHRTSSVLGHLLANPHGVTDQLTGAALQASAYSARPTLELAAQQVLALDATARGQMERVEVTGTDVSTLSGGSGSLTVTLVNGLDQPIIVGLKARTDSPQVKVETPEPVSMQPGERRTARLRVTSGVGVHDVTIFPVTIDGEETGTPLTFTLRTSQVGRLIWYIIIAGGTLLGVMIVRRIALRIRSNRWRRSEPR